jgi:hypothetical protein
MSNENFNTLAAFAVVFAHLKRIMKLDRLRLRGPCGARDEPVTALVRRLPGRR